MPRARHVTIAAAAAEHGVSERTMLARIREAGIRPRRVGRAAVLTESELEQVLDMTRERSPALPPPSSAAGRAAEAVRAQRRRESRRQIARARTSNIVDLPSR